MWTSWRMTKRRMVEAAPWITNCLRSHDETVAALANTALCSLVHRFASTRGQGPPGAPGSAAIVGGSDPHCARTQPPASCSWRE